jgi:hypothetical protein
MDAFPARTSAAAASRGPSPFERLCARLGLHGWAARAAERRHRRTLADARIVITGA